MMKSHVPANEHARVRTTTFLIGLRGVAPLYQPLGMEMIREAIEQKMNVHAAHMGCRANMELSIHRWHGGKKKVRNTKYCKYIFTLVPIIPSSYYPTCAALDAPRIDPSFLGSLRSRFGVVRQQILPPRKVR